VVCANVETYLNRFLPVHLYTRHHCQSMNPLQGTTNASQCIF